MRQKFYSSLDIIRYARSLIADERDWICDYDAAAYSLNHRKVVAHSKVARWFSTLGAIHRAEYELCGLKRKYYIINKMACSRENPSYKAVLVANNTRNDAEVFAGPYKFSLEVLDKTMRFLESDGDWTTYVVGQFCETIDFTEDKLFEKYNVPVEEYHGRSYKPVFKFVVDSRYSELRPDIATDKLYRQWEKEDKRKESL